MYNVGKMRTNAKRLEEQKKRYDFTLHPSLMAEIDTLARKLGTSRSNLIETLLKNEPAILNESKNK